MERERLDSENEVCKQPISGVKLRLGLSTPILLSILLVFTAVDLSCAESLEQLIEESLESNPEVLQARNEWDAAKARVPQVRWWGNPLLGVSYERIPEESYSPGAATMRMVSISQTIPFPGKLAMRGRVAQRGAMIAEERFEAQKQEVIAEVKSAYYRLFLVHRSIEIENEERELLRKFLKIVEAKYVLGQATQHDVLRAQIELALVSNRLITLEEEERPIAMARLNLLLDRPSQSHLEIPNELQIPEVQKSRGEIEKLALERRQALRILEHAVEKSRTAHALARMEYLPDFVLKFMRQEMETPMGTERTKGVMLSLSLPVWFWTKGYGVSEKSAQMRSAEASYEAMKNAVLFEVQAAVARCEASRRRVSLYGTTIRALAEQALNAGIVAYETGEIDFLSLVDSERTLRDAKLKHYEALAEYGENLALLEKVVGSSLVE